MASAPRYLRCRTRRVDLSTPVVMGVLNVTPDSFSDGGRYVELGAAVARARAMVEEGAVIVDVGGESTRPGAVRPSVDEEIRRVVPVVRAIADSLDVVISVDTSTPEVAAEAIAAGAGMINDVRGLADPATLAVVSRTGVAACVMHMQGEPGSMQDNPRYSDVVAEVGTWLSARMAACRAAGVAPDAIAVDPGFGFGKTTAHNLALLDALDGFRSLGPALLVGLSRKSMLGALTGRAAGERLAGSTALAALAAERGADIVRAHDVAATVDAVKVGAALRRAREAGADASRGSRA